ncbi:MAG: ChbG/HpnK family deacetylase [Chloroflexota bacterium]
MKYLIVNGDDFGASHGINRGIIEAHRQGILTSASLIVTTPWSEEAALLSCAAPDLSVGLHIHLVNEGKNRVAAPSADNCRTELYHQFFRFQELVGHLPTHLDSHHNVHRDPRLLPHFLELARPYDLPLREHSSVRYFSKFYGQWGGETHLEQIGVESLVRMLETEIQEGITELGCHPGYVDLDFSSGYSDEREIELRTLCDSRTYQALTQRSIQLVNFRDLGNLLPCLPI